MEDEIPYYKDYINNAIRGGIVSGCFLSVFIGIGIVNKFKWRGNKDEASAQEYEVRCKGDTIDHDDNSNSNENRQKAPRHYSSSNSIIYVVFVVRYFVFHLQCYHQNGNNENHGQGFLGTAKQAPPGLTP